MLDKGPSVGSSHDISFSLTDENRIASLETEKLRGQAPSNFSKYIPSWIQIKVEISSFPGNGGRILEASSLHLKAYSEKDSCGLSSYRSSRVVELVLSHIVLGHIFSSFSLVEVLIDIPFQC
ncbi:hypothetical protein HAX54_009131 [Datura stramonium]|uniref:Uncharacterized protein n=1 Tax=Datura stramonium TaxID=4076 RepID=A0ABS8TFB0_DATST|nr:hypothetical protein [Datura stramonium]